MDNPNQFRLLDSLPDDMLGEVFFHLGDSSVCRFYNNCSSRELRARTAEYLKPRVVKVTAEEVIEGDLDKIDFYEYGRLPQCHIEVKTPVGLLQVVLWHLSRVQYESLRLKVTNLDSYGGFQQLSLRGLVGNVVALTIDGKININPRSIPKSVAKLELKDCRVGPEPDFRHLVNLADFSCCGETFVNLNNLRLPHSVVTLGLPDRLVRAFDASSLPNLKHVKGGNIVGIPWEQIETARLTEMTGADKLSLNSEDSYRSFIETPTPNLKELEYDYPERGGGGGDASELFTNDQLARLTSLKGNKLTVSDMDALEQVIVLKIRLNEDLTEDFPLPPKLIDLTVVSRRRSVHGIPQKLERFSLSGSLYIDVNVKSEKLKSLRICLVRSVTIDCPKLTILDLSSVKDVGIVNALLVWKLKIFNTRFPLFEANTDNGSEKFPRLKDLEMDDLSENQDLIVKHRLRSVTLYCMRLDRVNITADWVTMEDCAYRENVGPPQINAKVLGLLLASIDTSHVPCQELIVSDDVVRVPQSVEKLSIDKLENLFIDETTRGHGDGPISLGLLGCNRLRSLEIGTLSFEGIFKHGIIIPASVKQVIIRNANWRHGTLRFEEGSQLEHLECWSPATMVQLGVSHELPPSLFHSVAISYMSIHGLRRQHRN